MPTVTQQTYFRRVLDFLYPERYQRYGTASAAGTTTLTDAPSFTTSFSQTSHLIGSWMRISGVTTGGTQYVQIAGVSAAGVITFDRAITQPTGTLTWELTYERHPGHIESLINRVLENTYAPRLFPLTSFYVQDSGVDDNDMEVSTATGWTAVSAGTAAKAAYLTALSFPHGTRLLQVDSGAADGVRQADTWAVTAGHQYWASVFAASAVSDSAEFQIYDVTGAAIIENAITDERAWMNLNFYFTPPTNCEEIYARLLGVAAAATTYWKDVSVINCDQKQFLAPYWLTKEAQMLDVFEMPRGASGPGGDNEYRAFETPLRSVPWGPAYNAIQSTNELTLEVPHFSGNPRYIYAMAPGVALSSDSGTSYIDADVVAANVCKLLKEPESEDRVLDNIRRTTLKSHHKIPSVPNMAYSDA